jgi:hypothetical protein
MARADRHRAAREAGWHRSPSKAGRRSALRRIFDEAVYRARSAKQREGFNRDLDVVDEKQRNPELSLTSILRKHHRDPQAFKRNVPTRKVGRRLQLAPPGERRLYRGPIRMLADVDGRPQVVEVTPSNDAQRQAIERHDAAVFASVTKEDDSDLSSLSHRVVVDAETGERFRFYTDGGGLRDGADSGEFELQDLYYSGGRRHDLDALLERESG